VSDGVAGSKSCWSGWENGRDLGFCMFVYVRVRVAIKSASTFVCLKRGVGFCNLKLGVGP